MDPEVKERLENLVSMVRDGAGFCPQCGVVATDGDSCCQTCGGSAHGAALDELLNDISNAINP